MSLAVLAAGLSFAMSLRLPYTGHMGPVILLAEDDTNFSTLIQESLKSDYTVVAVTDGRQAQQYLESNPADLLITDIRMPLMSGYDLAERVRQTHPLMPILMLTADQSFVAKRRGFTSGTDDYLTKPFNVEELQWRIQALLRRVEIDKADSMSFGELIITRKTFSISRGDQTLQLPNKEFSLLFKMVSEPGRIFTKQQIMVDVWGYTSDSSEDTIKTHISRLRNHLSPFPEIQITAIKGIGYKALVRS